MSLPDPTLPERFHRVLVEEIRERRPEYLREPFTVAEIYQDLIPYRTHRDRLGVEMNADYEDALLRLLAGEKDLLHLESDAARRKLRAALDAPAPDTGVFRNFAAASVRLRQAGVADAEAGEEADAVHPPPEEPTSEGDAAEEAAFDGATAADDPPAVAPGGARDGARDAAEETGDADAPDRDACPWCRERLPDRDEMHFCPFCGTSLDVVPCPECGEELERHWRFCVRCGTEVGA